MSRPEPPSSYTNHSTKRCSSRYIKIIRKKEREREKKKDITSVTDRRVFLLPFFLCVEGFGRPAGLASIYLNDDDNVGNVRSVPGVIAITWRLSCN